MFTKKITIIIPAYNIEDLIIRCIESVCAQTYPDELLEIIVVDDGSTDDTYARVQNYIDSHGFNADGKDSSTQDSSNAAAGEKPRILLLHQDNGGSSKARNLGLSAATGDYIGFVDADDYVDPHMYETLMKAIIKNSTEKEPVLMAQISRDEIAEDGTRLPDVCIPPVTENTVTGAEHMRTLLMHTGDASFCTKLTSRKLFQGECKGFPEGELNEDFYLMIHMLKRVKKLVILPQQYYHVFYRSGSNSRKKADQKDYFPPVFTDIVRNSDVARNLVKKNFPELKEEAMRFCLIQRLDYLLHIPISKMNRHNRFYKKNVVGFLRKHISNIYNNEYMTKRDKTYLTLFVIAPKTIRVVHAKIRGL
ncbi:MULTISPECIES: glycosyltransferase family 2 protein [unclassified Butyrivibrio]|uniref:glycosyltransferase family 2 protein n=1 Tax=unclassified Butyrivibrio TaxID=2639466 RepID=UPI0003B42DFB|nr:MULTISPECIES: glycosyltransferase family A protein [unclassified Butyrivibrio]